MKNRGSVTDGDRIRNLLGQYCELIDAGDWHGVGALFARGCLADKDGTELAVGSDAVSEFYARGTRLHDSSPHTKHLVFNTVIDDAASDGTIIARSSYLVLQGIDGEGLQPIITGHYVDRFAEDEEGEGWHFAERRFAVDLVGDLSHHLR